MLQVSLLQSFIRSNGYAWPGGYPCALLMADGECINAQSAKENYRQIRENMREAYSKDWTPVDVFINWENDALYCAHSNKRIDSAYGENV